MAGVFPMLAKVFERYRRTLGILLEVVNAYLYYGKELFKQHKEWVELVLDMAQSSLFTTEEPMELNNAEGAILFQIVLQTLGGGLLDPYMPSIITEVIKRLDNPCNERFLSVQLYNIFLCAVCNNPSLALNLPMTQQEFLVKGILDVQVAFEGVYNRKVLAIGLLNILMYGNMPELANKYYSQLLSTVISALQLQRLEELEKKLAIDKKEIKAGDNESSSDESDNEMGSLEEK
eukprot:TRINITY_DN6527_c0_g1_i10.p1 TRINITY_DN6527_c0_g1~~TRINITY_DN6527_c0_g1_i10.p1  ORF type:complete len:233 (+),score=46.52 TRINITY_DN6527_c0_g1_i10:99-797(+)